LTCEGRLKRREGSVLEERGNHPGFGKGSDPGPKGAVRFLREKKGYLVDG